jgi:8-oxo-dGTP pyrophosphatase MutT (NUDIX family)
MKKKAKVLFINKGENQLKVLLGLRKTEKEEFWWIPGGSIEGDENAYEALYRELQEELETGPVVKNVLENYLKNAAEPETIKFQRPGADYIIFVIPLPDSALSENIKILEEFTELRWFTYPDLPANLSREFVFADKLAEI